MVLQTRQRNDDEDLLMVSENFMQKNALNLHLVVFREAYGG
jgi:hypothetical protein